MQILVINSGSSSIKFQLFDMPHAVVVCSGLVERIGLESARIEYKTEKDSVEKITEIKDHKKGLQLVAAFLMDKEVGVITTAEEIDVIGHRVVHGGSSFANTTIIDQAVKEHIKELFTLAPLHNPANYEGIMVAEELFYKAKQVAVFDTAFHQTIPVKAHKYAINSEFLERHHIRVYGFHGTSHKYVTKQAMQFLETPVSKMITIHLGNGCSMAAIQNGKSIDTTLGFAPMNGLIMGTRSGDIDQSVIFHMMNAMGMTAQEVNDVLQKKSGMLGLTGYSDLRDIESEALKGDQACRLALEMNAYRIKKFIGAYAAIMNGLEVVVFTAGIGENSDTIRKLVCQELDFLGIVLDEEQNAIRSKEISVISAAVSKVKILVIPTNEELEIAQQSYALVEE